MKNIIFILLLTFSIGAKCQIILQEQPMWCWAACIQSVLWQANISQSQGQIVSRLTGRPQNRPANAYEVTQLLQSYNLKAWTVPYPANYQQLYETLKSGWKLIAFVNPTSDPYVGHFIILQGISYNGLIIISDPATGMTYEQGVDQLYYAWKWGSSIVVGRN